MIKRFIWVQQKQLIGRFPCFLELFVSPLVFISNTAPFVSVHVTKRFFSFCLDPECECLVLIVSQFAIKLIPGLGVIYLNPDGHVS